MLPPATRKDAPPKNGDAASHTWTPVHGGLSGILSKKKGAGAPPHDLLLQAASITLLV